MPYDLAHAQSEQSKALGNGAIARSTGNGNILNRNRYENHKIGLTYNSNLSGCRPHLPQPLKPASSLDTSWGGTCTSPRPPVMPVYGMGTLTSRAHQASSKHIHRESNVDRPIENPTNIHRDSNEHPSKLQRTSIEKTSIHREIQQTSIENPANIHR